MLCRRPEVGRDEIRIPHLVHGLDVHRKMWDAEIARSGLLAAAHGLSVFPKGNDQYSLDLVSGGTPLMPIAPDADWGA